MKKYTKIISQQKNIRVDTESLKNEEFLDNLQEALLLVLMDKKMLDRYQLDECLKELLNNNFREVT